MQKSICTNVYESYCCQKSVKSWLHEKAVSASKRKWCGYWK